MAKNVGLFGNIGRVWDAAGSLGGLAVDVVEGTIDLGSKAKIAIDNETTSLQKERDIENAMSRILAKAEAIKEIMKALNISAKEAEELLDKELK